MEPPNKAPDYEVGYAKPPRHTQFKKGQSGNRRGRPRGAKNVATVLEQALGERVIITENGRRKSATKMEVILKRLVNKAAQGDHRSIQLLIVFTEKHQASDTNRPPPTICDLLELVGPLPPGTTRERMAARQRPAPETLALREANGVDDGLAALAGAVFEDGNSNDKFGNPK
jgi:hypothetical protein